MDDGTTQIDHIIVSKFGIFVIETKNTFMNYSHVFLPGGDH
nr:nuclease-related domain-containing protein [Collimonas fungivorans]